MTVHRLKCADPYWEAVRSGDKTFEYRYNDRGFQKGDTVELVREFPRAILIARIGYVLPISGTFPSGWVCFSLLDVTELVLA